MINLAADKDPVLAEAFRVLEPGGRFAMTDVIVRGEVPGAIRRNMELWIGCVAGALSDRDYLDKLARAGFVDAAFEVTRIYGVDDAREFLAMQVDGKFASGFIRAAKPLAAATPAWAAASAISCCGG